MGLTLSEDLDTGTLVLLHHFDGEDVVDLNVMGGDAVVQEVGREHHVVSGEPEFRLILGIEEEDIAGTNEVEFGEYHQSAQEVHSEARVVQGTACIADKARKYGSHHGEPLVLHHPEVVCNSHESTKGVRAHLTGSHLEELGNSADKTGSLSETLVDKVLETSRVPE